MKKIYIFGAKSIALGVYKAVHELYPEYKIEGFLVSAIQGNKQQLAGLPVMELDKFSDYDATVLIATPENIHPEIKKLLDEKNINKYVAIDSEKESALMERYYKKLNMFPSIHCTELKPKVYMARSYRDISLNNNIDIPDWIIPVQAGTDLTDIRIGDVFDNSGDNISAKNSNYCELTVLYWMWKNVICNSTDDDYYGLCHYRRILDITDGDIVRINNEQPEAILPYPTIHEPDINDHHMLYVKEQDWNAMRLALKELQPEYERAFTDILKQPYLYNYNLIVAKRGILNKYCEWLFPILKRTEELSIPKGAERSDRYIGYLAESLMTLYFLHNSSRMKIYHTGRLMLT